MRVAIPHQLGREEARRRMHGSSDQIGNAIPGGMADIDASWSSEDQLNLAINAMGQSLNGTIEVGDAEIVFTMDLPMALSFIEPMVESAIRQQGQKMLAAPSGD